jgi:hypothetical protein
MEREGVRKGAEREVKGDDGAGEEGGEREREWNGKGKGRRGGENNSKWLVTREVHFLALVYILFIKYLFFTFSRDSREP